MGSPPTAWGRAKVNEDQCITTLTHAFAMSQYETTQLVWTQLGFTDVSNASSVTSGCKGDRCPTTAMSWNTVQKWLNELSIKSGLPACYDLGPCTGDVTKGDLRCPGAKSASPTIYDCDGFRLPTEAEWEYAARAGTSTAFYAGEITQYADTFTCETDLVLDGIGWYCKNSGSKTHPVGLKAPNAWGLFDMAGNAMEWVNDWYDGSGYGSEPRVDPWNVYSPDGGAPIVTRGGLSNGWAPLLRSFSRFPSSWYGGGVQTSFRIVRSLKTGVTLADLPDFTPPAIPDAGVQDAAPE